MDAKEFLKNLRFEVEGHLGVNHPLLARLSEIPFTKEDFKVFGLQHYPLVGHFTRYMELLLFRAPNSDTKEFSWSTPMLSFANEGGI